MSTPIPKFIRVVSVITVAAAALVTTSCMTTYDPYGRPVQSVDPGVALAGVAAAGLVGYALAEDNHHDYYRGGHGGHYRGYHPHY